MPTVQGCSGNAAAGPPARSWPCVMRRGGVPPAQELMQPNDMFAELVKAGRPTGGLRAEDLCVLAALGCGG